MLFGGSCLGDVPQRRSPTPLLPRRAHPLSQRLHATRPAHRAHAPALHPTGRRPAPGAFRLCVRWFASAFAPALAPAFLLLPAFAFLSCFVCFFLFCFGPEVLGHVSLWSSGQPGFRFRRRLVPPRLRLPPLRLQHRARRGVGRHGMRVDVFVGENTTFLCFGAEKHRQSTAS